MPDLSQNLPDTDEHLSRKIKQRRCIVTRDVRAMETLLRFCLSPDGQLTPDLMGKLPGRGAHLTPTRDVLAQAMKANAFSRAFKQSVSIPEGFIDHVANLMEMSLLARLAMARRAGHLALGQDAVFAAAGNGSLCLLILPTDITDNSSARLSGIRRDFPNLSFATADQLGKSLGRPRISNLAFTQPYKAEQFLTQAHKFRDFLGLKLHDNQVES